MWRWSTRPWRVQRRGTTRPLRDKWRGRPGRVRGQLRRARMTVREQSEAGYATCLPIDPAPRRFSRRLSDTMKRSRRRDAASGVQLTAMTSLPSTDGDKDDNDHQDSQNPFKHGPAAGALALDLCPF